VEIGGSQFDLGLAAEQGPGIATAQAVAGLLDVLVLLVVGFQVAAGVLRAGNGTGIVVFKGALILGAIGLDHHSGDVQFAAVIETDAVVAVEGGIGAVAHIGLVFPVVEVLGGVIGVVFRRVAVADATLFLGVVAALAIETHHQSPRAHLAAPHRRQAFGQFIVVDVIAAHLE